jgi:hypothetical protein
MFGTIQSLFSKESRLFVFWGLQSDMNAMLYALCAMREVEKPCQRLHRLKI